MQVSEISHYCLTRSKKGRPVQSPPLVLYDILISCGKSALISLVLVAFVWLGMVFYASSFVINFRTTLDVTFVLSTKCKMFNGLLLNNLAVK